jgi:N-acylneuraminate cytidylyltransferase
MPFQNPFKMWQIGADGLMKPLIGRAAINSQVADKSIPLSANAEPYNMPRQALPDVYWQTGYVDAAWTSTILEKHSMTGEHILPLVIDPSEWIDIDSPDDWRRAERLLESRELTWKHLGFEVEVLNARNKNR